MRGWAFALAVAWPATCAVLAGALGALPATMKPWQCVLFGLLLETCAWAGEARRYFRGRL